MAPSKYIILMHQNSAGTELVKTAVYAPVGFSTVAGGYRSGSPGRYRSMPVNEPTSDPRDEIKNLEADIKRLTDSQAAIRAANAALRNGDDGALRALGFTEEHIAELKKPDATGIVGFPSSAVRNNAANIRQLKRRIAELRAADNAEH